MVDAVSGRRFKCCQSMEPIRRFPADAYVAALESWAFLDLAGKRPLFTSPFGDVFFQSADGFWFLDVVGGELNHGWSTEQEFSESLNTREGQDQYLMIGLAKAADEAGLKPGASEVYGFEIPPVLGGATELSNVEVSDFVVALNLTGQIHSQVRDLPPGTPISGISLA
ncbi:T6SS immunity protein Tdi1 domain-containing protein [Paenarthrobacter sp. YIM B13468]|uniref:T6SS immunity protein Tdi1 domain-containing protein n=1 Tax=Paenarthrobacter sp. YIM B13468 TaxID=3366295 RepID=UPI00366F6E34